MDEFSVLIQAILDTSNVTADFNKIKSQLEKDKVKIGIDIDTGNLKNAASTIQKSLSNIKVSIDTSDIMTALNNIVAKAQSAGRSFGNAFSNGASSANNFVKGEQAKQQAIQNTTNAQKQSQQAASQNAKAQQQAASAQSQYTNAQQQATKAQQQYQQAAQNTSNVYKQLAKDQSLIENGVNARSFDNTFDAGKKAAEYFQSILQNENAVISVTENFNRQNGLQAFAVNVRRANGEVETLRYTLKELKDFDGHPTGVFEFVNSSATLNDAGAIKQIQEIENAISKYQQKFEQFKSTNNQILSGLTNPISNFESSLNGLKNGTKTVDDVSRSFNELNAAASRITGNFNKQLSPIDSAIRKLSTGKETINGLKAELKGLDNAPKGLSAELDNCSKSLENIKTIESTEGRTERWAEAYRQWADQIDAVTAKIRTLKKEQTNNASTQIFDKNTLESKQNPIFYISKSAKDINNLMSRVGIMARNAVKHGFGENFELVDVSGIKQAEGQIKSFTVTVKNAKGEIKSFEMERAKISAANSRGYVNGFVQSGNGATKTVQTSTQAINKEIANLNNLKQQWQSQGILVDEFKAKVEGVETALQSVATNGGLDAVRQQISGLVTEADRLTQLNNIQGALPQLESKFSNVSINMGRLNEASTELKNNFQVLKESLDTLNSTSATDDERIAAYTTFNSLLPTVTAQINAETRAQRENAKASQDAAKAQLTLSRSSTLSNNIQRWMNDNTKAAEKYREELTRLQEQLKNNTDTKLYQNASARFREIKSEVNATSKSLGTFGKSLKNGFLMMTGLSSTYMIFSRVRTEIKEAIDFTKQLDSALTNINYTMDVSRSQLENIGQSSIEMAKNLQTSTENVLQAVTLYANAKETATSILEKAEPAIMLSNVTGFSGEESAKYLQTIMNQFDLTQDDLMNISDTIQTVSQNIAHDFSKMIAA